jgi:hypothetical protein
MAALMCLRQKYNFLEVATLAFIRAISSPANCLSRYAG